MASTLPEAMTAPPAPATHTITRLLRRWREGDDDVLEELMPIVYGQLHRIASRYRRGPGDAFTLSPTALVHEAYLKLVGQNGGPEYRDRVHFFAAAALTMRRMLVDYARARSRQKRGGGGVRLELDEPIVELHGATGDADTEVLALSEALDRLRARDERKAKIVELHFFAGLTYDEVALVLDLSPATVGRELKFAKAWLGRELRSA